MFKGYVNKWNWDQLDSKKMLCYDASFSRPQWMIVKRDRFVYGYAGMFKVREREIFNDVA